MRCDMRAAPMPAAQRQSATPQLHVPTTLALLAGTMLTALGCGLGLPEASSGLVGCPASEISITDEVQHGTTQTTWTATCRGRVFYCSSTRTPAEGVTGGESGQHQCTPALGSPEPTNAAPPTRPAAAAPSASAASEPVPNKAFPEKALGFSFSSTPEEAQAACAGQGHQWQASAEGADRYECSGAGVDIGVPVRSVLSFCAGGLCELRAFATLASGAAGSRQLAKLRNALFGQYGSPHKDQMRVPSECDDQLASCVESEKASWSTTWEWDDGSMIRVRLGTVDGAAVVGIRYQRDQEQQAAESLNTDAF